MSYNEFKNKYNGKYIPSKDQAECWNLTYKYLEEMWGIGWIIAGCGYVINLLREPFMSNILKYFDEVPTTAMHPGDVVIWTDCSHIAIFDSWNERERRCYWLSQDSSSYAREHWTNNRVIGVYNSVATGKNFRSFRRKEINNSVPKPTVESQLIKVGDTVIVNGYGTASSDGTGATTRIFNNQTAKVIRVNGLPIRPYGLNLNNDMNGVTGWFRKEDIKKR